MRRSRVSRWLDPALVFEDSRLNNVFARTSSRAYGKSRMAYGDFYGAMRSGGEKRLNSASRLKIQIAWMLSIRALICSPDCGIKIDMRDRSVWQRRGSVAFLAGLHGNVGRRVTTPSGAVESSIARHLGTWRKFLNPLLPSPAFFMSYIYAIFISAKFSARGPNDIVSTHRGRRNFIVELNKNRQ